MSLPPPTHHTPDTSPPAQDQTGAASAIIGHVQCVLVGTARAFTRPGSRSAIHKTPVASPVAVGIAGLEGDEQGDRRVHGGPDKAVHCYPWAHYAIWQQALPACLLWTQPGAFGENFSITGLDEHDVCLADRWAIGTALFEVSQGRQPCWKLNDRFGVTDMARQVQASGRGGWYLRVLTPGRVAAGDAIRLIQRPHPDWPVSRLMQLIHSRNCDPATLQAILALPLPDNWRRLFSRRLEQGQAEDWTARLQGH